MPLAAILTTLSRTRCAAVLDVSCTGARLTGSDLPAAGDELEMKIETVALSLERLRGLFRANAT